MTTPSRRAVLTAALSGLVVFGLGGAAVALQPGVMRTPRRALLVLDARAFSTLAAVADRVCPGAADLPSAWALEVPEKVDALLYALHPATAAELRQVLVLLESGVTGLVFDGRIRPFTASPPEVQDTVLEGWRTSRLGLRKAAYEALVNAVSASYWSDPRTWAHVGYGGPPRFGA